LGWLTEVKKDSSLYASGVTTKYQYNNLGEII
jgi:hypothetical protein